LHFAEQATVDDRSKNLRKTSAYWISKPDALEARGAFATNFDAAQIKFTARAVGEELAKLA